LPAPRPRSSRRVLAWLVPIAVLLTGGWLLVRGPLASRIASPGPVDSDRGAAADLVRIADSGSIDRADEEPASGPAVAAREGISGASIAPVADQETEPRFFGRAVDQVTGEPVPGARITLLAASAPWKLDLASPRADPTLETDADGLVQVRYDPERVRYLALEAEGYGLRLECVEGGHESPGEALTIPLARAAAAEVRVLDPPPFPVELVVSTDASGLVLRSSMNPCPIRPDPSWVASIEGPDPVRFDGLPPDVLLGVSLRTLEQIADHPRPVRLRPGETAEISVSWSGGFDVAGVLVDPAGHASPDRAIWAQPADRAEPKLFPRTGPDGGFVLGGLGPGWWWIGPAPSEACEPGALAPVGRRFLVVDDTTVLRVEASPGPCLCGRVLDPSGEPAGGAAIEVVSGSELLIENAGDDGAFCIGPLPVGEVRIRAHPDFAEDLAAWRPATAGDSDVELVLEPGMAVSGRIVWADPASEAPLRVQVVPDPPEGRRWLDFHVQGFGDELFVPEALSGSFTIVCTTERGWIGLGPVRADPGRSYPTATIRMEPGARLRVRLGPDAPPQDLWIRSDGRVIGGERVDPAADAVLVVPPGPLELVRSSDGRVLESWNAHPGTEHLAILR